MPKLHLVYPDGTEARFALDGDHLTIGRAEDNDIVLPDLRSSSHHLALKRIATGEYVANDLGATNPTRINGKASVLHELKHGDTLLIGDTYARYESSAAAAATPAQPPGRPQRQAGSSPAPEAQGKGCFAMLAICFFLALGGATLAAVF